MKLTDAQWRERLTDEEFRVCREKGTEMPFTGALLHNHESGHYLCKCCGAKLFESADKFDAHCGWPSFSDESADLNVGYHADDSHGMQRIEIVCKQCDAHLGHVFDDGPVPTGRRYCVNSVSISFEAAADSK